MGNQTSRRDVLKGSLALAGLSVLGLPEWALPALAQGETVVPFTDWPENFNPAPAPIGGCSTAARLTARSRQPISSSRRSITVIPSWIRRPSA